MGLRRVMEMEVQGRPKTKRRWLDRVRAEGWYEEDCRGGSVRPSYSLHGGVYRQTSTPCISRKKMKEGILSSVHSGSHRALLMGISIQFNCFIPDSTVSIMHTSTYNNLRSI